MQFFDRGRCPRAARWISDSPSSRGYASGLEAFGRISQHFPSWSCRATLGSTVDTCSSSATRILRSFLLSSCCGHARRQQRQWHVFYWYCWSSCTSAAFPMIAGGCSCGVMPQIMDIVKVFRDVETIVALCHRSWRNRKVVSAFSGVEQIVAPRHRSWRNSESDTASRCGAAGAVCGYGRPCDHAATVCLAPIDVPQIQFVARVCRQSSSQLRRVRCLWRR